MALEHMLGRRTGCSCGRDHDCDIRHVVIGPDALAQLPGLAGPYQKILMVCDENTRRVCGTRAEALLGSKVRTMVYPGHRLVVPNEEAIAALEGALTPDTDLILGVGSGVISDLCKYVSFGRDLPYFIVATAPSMDGYASKGAAMLLRNMKITVSAHVPQVILADTAVLREAPMEMLQAGYGDIIGKFSCLNDWRLGALVNGEYLCEETWQLTWDTACRVAELGPAIAAREEAAVGTLMEALVQVGIAMAHMGNSRPASGSEHHLSHFFEVTGLLWDQPYLSHGVDVACSAWVTAKLRQQLLALEEPGDLPFDRDAWEQNIRRVYGKAADGILELQNGLGWYHRDLLPRYRAQWPAIRALLAQTPGPEEIRTMLEAVGLDLQQFLDLYSPRKLADALRYAKDLKDRYTVLWLWNRVCGKVDI